MKKLHLPALGPLAISLSGILLSPVVLGIVSPKVATILSSVGALLQAVSRPALKTPQAE